MRKASFYVAACVASLLTASAGARAGTVVVTPGNMGAWAFDNRDGNGIAGQNPTGVGGMVNGPATPPLGVGSAHLATGNGTTGGDGGEDLRSTAYDGVRLASLMSLGYSTYNVQNNGQQFPYLALDISPSGTGPADPNYRMFFEPPYQTPGTGNPSLPNQGATQMNTWQSWNALSGGWWDNSGIGDPGAPSSSGVGVQSFATFLNAHPNATIAEASDGNGGFLGGLELRVGYASAGNVFSGYVDALTIGVSGSNTTYNFEATSTPEPVTASIFAVALAALGAARRRRATG